MEQSILTIQSETKGYGRNCYLIKNPKNNIINMDTNG